MASQTDSETNVVIFTIPGMLADTRLKFFTAEFHVHSALLKIYSGFFRENLDSPDDSKSRRGESGFKYDLVTVVNADGNGWDLVAASKQKQEVESPELSWNPDKEVNCFQKLLQVMYGCRLQIKSAHDLKALTKLAQSCGSLRMISRALDASIGRQEFSFHQLDHDPCAMLQVATQLRNPRLFRECLILSLNPWSLPRYEALTNTTLRELASHAHEKVKANVEDAKKMIDSAVDAMGEVDPILKAEMEKQIVEAKRLCRRPRRHPFHLPAYFLTLSNFESRKSRGRYPFKPIFSVVLKNNLTLNSTCIAGWMSCSNYFLCGEILDKDLPWGTDKRQW
ncbi:hypothetical protein BKA64DRAFT_776621 [Cadophora sp. MPI-SDFR-AT-0126]|nr:hypothetical protein BKA64DRAFT_776621 [Leotiomycetes sp. MPI-SDFR-AT-0126]